MEQTSQIILSGAALMLVSVLAGQLAMRLGAPVLLTFLGVGVFFGENGPGGIVFNDSQTAFFVCSIALAMILFDGGLRTRYDTFRQALLPASALSTLGVLITAGITGSFATWLMSIDIAEGLLIGSIVASTDAAAVFLLLHQRGIILKQHVSATLEVESGINDPMAVFLTISCVSFLSADANTTWPAVMGHFLKEMGLGLAIGYVGGIGLARLLQFVRIDPGLYPVVVLAGGLVIFACTNVVGGSGFLAVYLAGIMFRSRKAHKSALIKQFNDGMAWIAQLVMLLTLGLFVTPMKLVEHMGSAILIAICLIAVARPLAVWCSLLGQQFEWKEKTFISWVGLRGAIPLYLALIPALAGVENGQQYFGIAFIIVVSSLLLQGWTINPLARKLRIVDTSATTEIA